MDEIRILLVEDETPIADTIRYALETEGMAVIHCLTGADATTCLADGGVSLAVLDVGLPDINGFDLCREWRRTSMVPVIFLTARGEEVDRIVGLEIGADDYVVKPFSPRELAARVRAVLRRSRDARPVTTGETTTFGPFVVDDHRRQISYLGQVLDLVRYEYRLLKALIDRPGWVFSRSRLMDLVWDEPDASLERTVDAHVKGLRAKLRVIRDEPQPILTHRGQGYSLREDW